VVALARSTVGTRIQTHADFAVASHARSSLSPRNRHVTEQCITCGQKRKGRQI
jgi:hypothetical protein